jgi:hypothetical protein
VEGRQVSGILIQLFILLLSLGVVCTEWMVLIYCGFSGARNILGSHCVRPEETYHEPNRRFYPNEVLRSPISEIVPIDLIHARCWVVDPPTFCKGRPLGNNNKTDG